jgi:ribosomal protein S18 acetylase RimI-like enzyme
MPTYEPVKVEQYDEFLQLGRDQAANYFERTMELMQMTWQQCDHMFRTVGQVYGICENDQVAGFYWIEERGKVLHLHGLVLKEQFQGKGIGTQVLKMLETKYRGSMDAIELGVHKSNEKASALYERLGYETVKRLEDFGFYIMQKRLSEE